MSDWEALFVQCRILKTKTFWAKSKNFMSELSVMINVYTKICVAIALLLAIAQ